LVFDALELSDSARPLPARIVGIAIVGFALGCAGLVAGFAGHFAHLERPSPQPRAELQPIVEPMALPLPQLPAPTSTHTISPPAPVATASVAPHHRHRLIARSERHHVKGLAPNTGLVSLRTKAGVEVAMDGLWVGMTPVRAVPLSEGSHVLELRTGPKSTQVLDLDVTSGDEVTLFLNLE
jgi:hypothetical protein